MMPPPPSPREKFGVFFSYKIQNERERGSRSWSRWGCGQSCLEKGSPAIPVPLPCVQGHTLGVICPWTCAVIKLSPVCLQSTQLHLVACVAATESSINPSAPLVTLPTDPGVSVARRINMSASSLLSPTHFKITIFHQVLPDP